MMTRAIAFLAFLSLSLAGMGAGAGAASGNAGFDELANSMTGHWACSSQTGAKTTVYTSDWARVPGTLWIRGINRFGARQSEDVETYDAVKKEWRIVDMEPEGTMSVMAGTSTTLGHVSTQSVFPDDTQKVTYGRVSPSQYTLTFDFLIAGKHERWVDTCNRS
jgi:hypothetical protein